MAFAAASLIAIIFLVESEIARHAVDIPLAGHLLLFALLSVVTLLLILVLFFLIRNIFKLVFERRQKVFGANLRSRLTLAFVALTLVPTVVLFMASAGVLHTTIESWFKGQVEESLQSSLLVAQTYYQDASVKLLKSCSRLVSTVEDQSLLDADRREVLDRTMRASLAAEGLGTIQIYFSDGATPLLLRDPALDHVPIPPPEPSFLKIGFQGEKTSKIMPLEGGSDLVRAITPMRKKGTDTTDAVLVADLYIPRSLSTRLSSISGAFGEYQEAKRMKGPVKTVYILLLLMVALLVIFIGFWFGMTMARDITDPILKLAEGTEKIAEGDLDVYIEPVADDELGVLVRSFNEMTADLRKGRDELLRVNLDLESRRKYMETVLTNVAAGVLALDGEGRVTTINDSARRLLGITGTDLLGKPLLEILPETSCGAVAEALDDLSSSETAAVERHITLSFPEKVVTLLCFANSLRDEEARDLGFVLVFEDMTYLVKAQRMAAWREVARRIAHEIKNPLTPIQLNAQRIRRKYLGTLSEGEVLDRCTTTIIDQVEELKNMVNEFSKFARMPGANPVPNDLNAVIDEVVALFRQGSDGRTFIFEPDDEVPVFDLDKEQMKRAMVNLLDNAAAAAGERGTVRVSTSYDGDLSIASIEVVDNGPGIDPRDRDRVFEPYFSRKSGGTGLGLTIVSTIISDHNGFIRVKDGPGGGARFVIELPVRKA